MQNWGEWERHGIVTSCKNEHLKLKFDMIMVLDEKLGGNQRYYILSW